MAVICDFSQWGISCEKPWHGDDELSSFFFFLHHAGFSMGDEV